MSEDPHSKVISHIREQLSINRKWQLLSDLALIEDDDLFEAVHAYLEAHEPCLAADVMDQRMTNKYLKKNMHA